MANLKGTFKLQDEVTQPVNFFNAIASIYDRSTGGSTREFAREILKLPQFDLPSDAVVLDNGCGTGAVIEEIIIHKRDAPIPQIVGVDPANALVDVAREKVAALPSAVAEKITLDVMSGEKLGFDDNTFTHTFTHLALPFFSDPVAGAKEIYRTLKPGGVAAVTTWVEVGFLRNVIQPAQKAVRPDQTPFNLPVKPEWFEPGHLTQVIKDGGFEKVASVNITAHHSLPTREQLVDWYMTMSGESTKDWSEEEKAALEKEIEAHVNEAAIPMTMVAGGQGFGIPSIGIVVVAHK
ncbi:hypothetical protein jhhlp_007497 [Lomentospora prolificans]|uniref:Methyltransferase type 11 domain-containing protein n=1 Tax=Lomentospora prolificans TaxID=41688 RepID=A0A2N3N174_9PEZI|nr:hypothetical protein jhhlp_007497 [Lomentospora prolificans]